MAAASDHRAGSEQEGQMGSCGWLVVRYPEHLGLNELDGIVGSASAQLRHILVLKIHIPRRAFPSSASVTLRSPLASRKQPK